MNDVTRFERSPRVTAGSVPRFTRTALALLLLAAVSTAAAELQQIQVGGQIQLRANWFSHAGASQGRFVRAAPSDRFVEQRTRLNTTASFTGRVSAVIEIDNYGIWGEDLRSDYITASDTRPITADDVEIHQAYIEIQDLWQQPITLRAGRQEIRLGAEWLVGNNDAGPRFRGLSFDGVRAIYETDSWTLTAFTTKLAENSPIEEDGDIDFHGVYLAVPIRPSIQFDAYWLFLRDARGEKLGFPHDTPNQPGPGVPTIAAGRLSHRIEGLLGVDQYPKTSAIHTFGLRLGAQFRQWDLQAEAAWQRARPTNTVKRFFNPDFASRIDGISLWPFAGPYGEDGAAFESWGLHAELGYALPTPWRPRIYAGFAWFEGHDNRRNTFGEFVRNLFPAFTQDASYAFNRLFSDTRYSEFLDDTTLSNVLIARGGLTLQPTERLDVHAAIAWFQTDSPTSTNARFLGIPFTTRRHAADLGLETALYLTYNYSQDLQFRAGFAHFFARQGLRDGQFVGGNGLLARGGGAKSGANYVFLETTLRF